MEIIALIVGIYALLIAISLIWQGWMSHTVSIAAPIKKTWDYGSDSTRAKEWSVYFDHITPIEGDGRPKDGTIGSFRICYRNEDESGPCWSETTEAATALEHREIRTFELENFPFGFVAKYSEFEVHQDYISVDENSSKLRFRSRPKRAKGVMGLLLFPLQKMVYLSMGRPVGLLVFVWNLENIAEAVQSRHAGREYVRPHPYSALLPWEAKPTRWWIQNILLRGRFVKDDDSSGVAQTA